MRVISRFLIIFIVLPFVCNSIDPLCQTPQNKKQLFGLSLFTSGLSCAVGSLPQFMKVFYFFGGPSGADRISIKKQIFKQSCMIFALGVSATITGFLMLDCNLTNKTSKI